MLNNNPDTLAVFTTLLSLSDVTVIGVPACTVGGIITEIERDGYILTFYKSGLIFPPAIQEPQLVVGKISVNLGSKTLARKCQLMRKTTLTYRFLGVYWTSG